MCLQAAYFTTMPEAGIFRRKKRVWVALALVLVVVAWLFCLPRPLFSVPYSTVLMQGEIPVAVSPAADGQVRFPTGAAVPPKLAACVVAYEDRRFYHHIGIDPLGMLRAARTNLKAGRIRQGGSTLTMQVARLAGGRRGRNIFRKLLELAQALRLEAGYSKEEILALWADHAPFGGNTAGLQAASWRYFGQPPERLTWAECATLAVLPNAPGLMHPGRGRTQLRERRNRLLAHLAAEGKLNEAELAAAQAEPLPEKPLPLPNQAPHLLAAQRLAHPQGGLYRLTLNTEAENAVQAALGQHQPALAALGVGNAACLVADLRTGRVLAYKSFASGYPASAPFVDAVQAPRSYGSLLKPFLYAHALDAGKLAPQAWLEDVPKLFGRFAPRNFYNQYDGVVPASRALARSLNLPYVNLLERYGQRRFCGQMKAVGLRHLYRPADDYGLALILGSGEATLWQMGRLYTLAGQRTLGLPPRFGVWEDSLGVRAEAKPLPSPAALFTAFEALSDAARPDLDPYWQQVLYRLPIAWKTGTSQGLRDAWAIGCTRRYMVAVWCGNADGEGRMGLTGIHVAAPILFEIAARLEEGSREATGAPFPPPPLGWTSVRICPVSGWRAGPFCPPAEATTRVPAGVEQSPVCPYHRQVYVDAEGTGRVEAPCYPLPRARAVSELYLPPLQDYYARKRTALPGVMPWRAGCGPQVPTQIHIQTPGPGQLLTLAPTEDGSNPTLVLTANSSQPQATLHWHLDGRALGHTNGTSRQSMPARLGPGVHHLVVVASDGAAAESQFTTQ